MHLFKQLQNSIIKYNDRHAFYINDVFYTYHDLALSISRIRKSIQICTNKSEKNVGLVTNDDIETYACIIALWFEGKAYIPLNNDAPIDRNRNIIKQAGIKTIIDSSENPFFSECNIIESKKLPLTEIDITPKIVSDQELVYILFTSGTTGIPKGVPITIANISAFINAFEAIALNIEEEDKCLQMFQLTFDASVVSYLPPLLKGSCVYTIPHDKIKYTYIFELMEKHGLTVILIVPSILHFLHSYFHEICLPNVKICWIFGEALPLDVTEEWSQCLPNAKILNGYGPTEYTILSTHYIFNRLHRNKTHNGILSIGRALKGTDTVIIDKQNNLLAPGETGELCLAGLQLTPGYWNDEEKNKEAFFFADYKGKPTGFYKTGDLCYIDDEGDIMYLGRLDFQAKIQGFRVELLEVEFHAKAFLNKINSVAISLLNKIGNTEIALIIESREFDTNELLAYMKTKLPAYMIPTQIKFVKVLPLNTNGKTDRKKLIRDFTKAT